MSFDDRLILEYLDGRTWKLTESLGFLSKKFERRFAVPANFITDFASIPRIFWRLFPPTGKYGKAAVLHDYLYAHNGVTRSEADGVFLEAMEELEVGWLTRHTLHKAVRAGGWLPWKRYRASEKDTATTNG